MVNKVTSKLQVVYHPMLPATCAVCNRSANGNTKFLDFQKDLDYYGAVVICEDCFREGLEVLDFVPVARVNELEETIQELEEQNLRCMEELAELNGFVDTLSRVRPDLHPDSDRVNVVDGASIELTDSGTSDPEPKFA